MIRRRAVLGLILIVGVIILVLAYSGIESSRENMLELIAQEGESMMQALVTSAGNNLSATTIVEEISAARLVETTGLLARLVDASSAAVESLSVWERRFELEQVSLVDDEFKITRSSWSDAVGIVINDSDRAFPVLDSIIEAGRPSAVVAPYPSALPRDELIHAGARTRSGVLLITAKARKLTDYQESLGIGFVVRKMGGQDAIDYVVLQNDSGIVLASRDIGPMVAIASDPFLVDALEHEEIVHRVFEFDGKEVLEVVRSFRSDVMPSGLLRIGMSLEGYRLLYADSLKQLAILSIVLFALGVVGAYTVTSLKKLQVTTGDLEQLRSMTDEIVQSLEAAVVAVDVDGKVSAFNPQAERLFGKPARAVIGQSYQALFANDLLGLSRIAGDSTQRFRGEVSYPDNAGGARYLLISASPVLGKAAEYSGAVALAYDLTELKRLEESARAAERLSELGTLAAGVAHEIRNPLNAISIAAQRLQLEFKPTENAEEYSAFLKTIGEEIERLNFIIKDFLSLARGQRVAKVLVDVKEYLNDIAALARIESEQRGIRIEVQSPEKLTTNIDPGEMKKVFHNLIQNALQSMASSGDIKIRANALNANRVQIDVTNSGVSIPNEVRARIFQPYFSTKADGTGLGLAICRRIVADHGGTIELLEGEPTTFRIVV